MNQTVPLRKELMDEYLTIRGRLDATNRLLEPELYALLWAEWVRLIRMISPEECALVRNLREKPTP